MGGGKILLANLERVVYIEDERVLRSVTGEELAALLPHLNALPLSDSLKKICPLVSHSFPAEHHNS